MRRSVDNVARPSLALLAVVGGLLPFAACTSPAVEHTADALSIPQKADAGSAWVWGATPEAFSEGSAETQVPIALLVAISNISSAGDTPGCDGAERVGVMGLLKNSGEGADATEAADAAGATREDVETRQDANIAAAAAWLRKYAGPEARPTVGADWFEAVKTWPGSVGPAAQVFAAKVFQEVLVIQQSLDEQEQMLVDPDLINADAFKQASKDYASAVWVPGCSSNFSAASRGVADIDRVVIHTVQGSAISAVNWFANCAAKVSAHYTVSKTGEVVQSVRDRDVAWHAAHWFTNQRSIGIEHGGFVADPGTWTTPMLAASAQLTAAICKKYGIPIDRTHIIGHHEVPGCPNAGGGGVGCHTDPQPHFPWKEYIALVKQAAGSPGQPKKPSAPSGPPADAPSPCQPEPVSGGKGPIYDDVAATSFAHPYVAALYGVNAIRGCGLNPPMFCPWCDITRKDFVVWVAKAAGLTPMPTAANFKDVNGDDQDAPWLAAAKDAGFIAGCGGGNLCGDKPMLAADAATLLTKAAKLATAGYKGLYSDVPASSSAAVAIEALSAACVNIACSSSTYCPNKALKRSSAAFAIARAFDLDDLNPCLSGSSPPQQPAPKPAPQPSPKLSPKVGFTSPAEGSTLGSKVVFEFTTQDVEKVQLVANGWALTPKLAAKATQKFSYTFQSTGTQSVQLLGYDANGQTVTAATLNITVAAKASVVIAAPTSGAKLTNPVQFEVQTVGAHSVELRRQDKVLTSWSPLKGPFASVSFDAPGPKWVEAWIRDKAGAVLAKDGVLFETVENPAKPTQPAKPAQTAKPTVAILNPKDGDTVSNPVTFTVSGSGVDQVQLFADGWALGKPFDHQVKGQHTYQFNSLGKRSIKLHGFDANGTTIASASLIIHVVPPPSPKPTAGGWAWVMNVDHGLRADSAGLGPAAPRYGNAGGHR